MYFRPRAQTIESVPTKFKAFIDRHLDLARVIDELFLQQVHSEKGVYQGACRDFLCSNPEYDTGAYSVTVVHGDCATEVPYYIAYEDFYKQLTEITEQIIAHIKELKDLEWDQSAWIQYYQELLEALKTDAWDRFEECYLQMDPQNPFLLNIGPIEKYHDKLRGAKRFFTCVFMIRSSDGQQYQQMWKQLSVLVDSRNPLIPSDYPPASARLFVGDVLVESGEISKLVAEAWSRPDSTKRTQEYGTLKMLMLNVFDEKLESLQTSSQSFLKLVDIDESFSSLLLSDLSYLCKLNLVLHEYGHTYLKPVNAAECLRDSYTLFEEPRAEINSIYLAQLLEAHSVLEPGTTLKLFMSDLTLFNYKFDRWVKLGMREEYLYFTAYSFHCAMIHEAITVRDDKIVFHLDTLELKLPLIINQIFTFFNTATQFAHWECGQVGAFRDSMKEFCSKLRTYL